MDTSGDVISFGTVSLLGLLTAVVSTIAVSLRHGPTRQRASQLLTRRQWLVKYHSLLDWFLKRLSNLYGKPRSLKALGVCLTFAAFYNIFFLSLGFVLGAPSSLLGIGVFPRSREHAWLVPVALLALVAWGVTVLLRRKAVNRAVGGWFEARRIHRFARRPAFGATISLLCVTLFVATRALGLLYPSVEQLHPGVVAGVAFVVGTLLPPTASLSGLLFLLVAWSLRFPLSVTDIAFVYLAALVFGVVPFTLATFGAFAFGSALIFGFVEGKTSQPAVALFATFPLINGLADWVSWQISRHYLKDARSAQSWKRPARGIFIDLCCAVVLSVALVLGLALVSAAVAHLFDDGIAHHRWSQFARYSAAHPWSHGAMVTLMLLTTLIPTSLHILLALIAWSLKAFPSRNLAAKIRVLYHNQRASKDNFIDPFGLAFHLTGYAGIAALILVSASWLSIEAIRAISGDAIAQGLLNIASVLFKVSPG